MFLPPLKMGPTFAWLLYTIIDATASPAGYLSYNDRQEKWGYDWGYSGMSTFGHLPHSRCLKNPDTRFDIAIVGAPFDSGATYRPGARLGPRAIRAASCRHPSSRAFNSIMGINPYTSWAHVLDCDDIPVIPFDSAAGLQQMTEAMLDLYSRKPLSEAIDHPRLIILGGDHTISLPVLRALRSVYASPVTLLHFDSHLDTLRPDLYPSANTFPASVINHGTVFWHAVREDLLAESGSLHVGVNTRLSGSDSHDYQVDDDAGFVRIPASDIDTIGANGIVQVIKDAIPDDARVYLSIDIDVLDPAFAPGTGAPEPGGWSTRELLYILRGIGKDFDIVGADIVEVSPPYDTPGGDTAFVAAGLVYEIISCMVWRHNTTSIAQESRLLTAETTRKEL